MKFNQNISNNTMQLRTESDQLWTRYLFALIAIFAIIGNSSVLLLYHLSKKMQYQICGILICNLALVDCLTGIAIFITPVHIFGQDFPYPTSPLAGMIFCAIIGSEIIIFTLGFISVYILAVLSVERYYAMVKSNKYQRYFVKSRLKLILFGIWIWCFILNLPNIFQTRYRQNVSPPCQWIPLPGGRHFNMAIYAILFTFRFLLPMICIFLCYACIWRYTITILAETAQSIRGRYVKATKIKTRVTITCLITSIAFILCWLPNQIYFTLVNFDLAHLNNNIHYITKLLLLFNSCINPFIYALTNPYYRKDMIKVLPSFRNS